MNVQNILNAVVNAFRNGKSRKGHVRRGLVAFVLMVVTLCVAVTTARADTVWNNFPGSGYDNDTGESQTTHVKQGDDGNTFASAAPIATIYIDPSINTVSARNAATVEILYSGTGKSGFRTETAGDETNMLVYDTSVDGATLLEPETDNFFEGDICKFTYKDMATLQDGSSADVVITYHDAHFALKNNSYQNDKGALKLGSCSHVRVCYTNANQNSRS